MIEVGKTAPAFTLPDAEGKSVSLADYLGQNVLLVFYPGDNTPVCTTQLCSYRDSYDEFKKRGLTVFGISTDSSLSHEKFNSQFSFPFPLLSDAQKNTCRAYDALSFLGTSQRAYVLIDKKGIVKLSFSELLPLFFRTPTDLLAQLDAALNTNS